ncbi:hypothetical protein [Hymenobacter sp.]|jgi:hypothetical protein|uniref:hypothetical protein n=1 Tax=Hymenobacter sp. TaxID=1898978 RepID=UPI002EDA3698
MFGNYKINFAKVNLHWAQSVSIELDEIEELLELSPLTWLYLGEAGEYEITGYTKYRKFVTVTFTLTENEAVVESVNLPSYGRIREVVIRQYIEPTK